MKRGLILWLALCLLPVFPSAAAESAAKLPVRAVWVSTYMNLDYPSAPGLSPAQLKSEADAILERAAALGLTDILFQVHPCADALYESAVFPVSACLTGKQGGDPGLDVLAYWVEKAHSLGLRLHAWLNPYRVTGGSGYAYDDLAENHPARLHPEWCVQYDGAWYFDPGIEEVRAMAAAEVERILSRYDVDGIHLDDYFYPGVDFGDAETFAAEGTSLSVEDWRRENLTDQIRRLSEITRAHGKAFGVSPCGIWANAATNEAGSDTRGRESYSVSFADVRAWMQEKLLDYCAPQIYWALGEDGSDFGVLAQWWSALAEETGVPVWVGHAAYKQSRWEAGELLSQLAYIQRLPGITGSAFFRWQHIAGTLGESVQKWDSLRKSASLTPEVSAMPEVWLENGALYCQCTADAGQEIQVTVCARVYRLCASVPGGRVYRVRIPRSALSAGECTPVFTLRGGHRYSTLAGGSVMIP